jgi:hypothetical protein
MDGFPVVPVDRYWKAGVCGGNVEIMAVSKIIKYLPMILISCILFMRI